jgi:transcriptional regulator with XRE-family HTH domain
VAIFLSFGGSVNCLAGQLRALFFGRALRAARKSNGVAQEWLAEYSEVDRTYHSLLERGLRPPSFFVILELATAPGIPPAVLFCAAVSELPTENTTAEEPR